LNFSSAGAVAEEAVILAGSTIPGNFARPGCAGFSWENNLITGLRPGMDINENEKKVKNFCDHARVRNLDL
jgi:hypothetical protein